MQQLRVAHQQLVRGVAAPLRARLFDSDGDEATGLSVTVDIARADGTVLATGAAATEDAESPGTYTAALTAAQLATLDMLVATWKEAGITRTQTLHEVCGGYYFTPKEARNEQPSITTAATPDDRVRTARRDVEAEFEAICKVAFVPRFARVRISGDDCSSLILPHPMVRTVRTVRIYNDATAYTALGPTELASLDVDDDGTVTRLDRGRFVSGIRNVVVEYEYGHDQPPGDLRAAAMQRLRERINRPTSAIPPTATTFQIDGSSVYRLATASKNKTGNPDIDGVLDRYAWKSERWGMA